MYFGETPACPFSIWSWHTMKVLTVCISCVTWLSRFMARQVEASAFWSMTSVFLWPRFCRWTSYLSPFPAASPATAESPATWPWWLAPAQPLDRDIQGALLRVKAECSYCFYAAYYTMNLKPLRRMNQSFFRASWNRSIHTSASQGPFFQIEAAQIILWNKRSRPSCGLQAFSSCLNTCWMS